MGWLANVVIKYKPEPIFFFHHLKISSNKKIGIGIGRVMKMSKKARVKRPDQSVFKMTMGSMETYQLISTVLSGNSKYFIMN